MRKLLCCLSIAAIAVLIASEAFSAPPRGGRGRPGPAYRGPAAGTPVTSQTAGPPERPTRDSGRITRRRATCIQDPTTRRARFAIPNARPGVAYKRYTPGWYATHPGSWWATHPHRPLRYATWAGLAGWVGLNTAPVYYDYGYDGTEAVVTYPDDEDYTVNPFEAEQPQFDLESDQANANWYPLGMFNLVPPGHNEAVAVLQLAIAKDGTVAGTYQDVRTDKIHQLHGTLDKQTQKVSWTLDTNKSVVYETGMHNLIEPITAVIVNFGDNKKQKWTLERMEFEQPEQDARRIAVNDRANTRQAHAIGLLKK